MRIAPWPFAVLLLAATVAAAASPPDPVGPPNPGGETATVPRVPTLGLNLALDEKGRPQAAYLGEIILTPGEVCYDVRYSRFDGRTWPIEIIRRIILRCVAADPPVRCPGTPPPPALKLDSRGLPVIAFWGDAVYAEDRADYSLLVARFDGQEWLISEVDHPSAVCLPSDPPVRCPRPMPPPPPILLLDELGIAHVAYQGNFTVEGPTALVEQRHAVQSPTGWSVQTIDKVRIAVESGTH